MSITVYLARHGASDAYDDAIEAERDIFRQTKSTHLGKRGIGEAQKLGHKVARLRTDVLLTSPYLRARQTAEIVTQHASHLFPNVVDNLRETRRIVDGHSIYSQLNLDYKRWRGETIRSRDLTAKFHSHDESFGELFDRAIRVKELLREFDSQTIMVISHSQLLAMLMSGIILGSKPNPGNLFESFNRLFMSHCGLTKVTYDLRHGWRFNEEDFNLTDHLK